MRNSYQWVNPLYTQKRGRDEMFEKFKTKAEPTPIEASS